MTLVHRKRMVILKAVLMVDCSGIDLVLVMDV
jgi:hypothetical protein